MSIVNDMFISTYLLNGNMETPLGIKIRGYEGE